MGDDRPAVYLEGNTVIYRASALGHCLRSLWAARSNMPRKPVPDVIKKAMDEGTDLESHILNLLHDKHNFGFGDGQQFVVELNVGAWNGKTLIVRGAMDEKGYRFLDGDDPIAVDLPVDVKAFSQSGVDDYVLHGLKDYYEWQQSVYAHGYGTSQFYCPIYNKDTGLMVPDSLFPRKPKYSREQIRDRVLLVEELFSAGTIPTDCPADYACQYPYIHDGKETDLLPHLVVPMVAARLRLSEKIRVFDAARKTLDQAIKSKIEQGTSYKFQGWTITVTPNADRFNTTAAKVLLREAGIDYDNDPEFIIPGEGTKVTMTPPRKPKNGI